MRVKINREADRTKKKVLKRGIAEKNRRNKK